MALDLINIGAEAGDGTGDAGRVAFNKVNNNLTELFDIKSQVSYTAITTATRVITDAELVVGTNIFGVNYAGAVTVTLPAITDTNKVIVINDESGAAGANNITIEVA